MQLVKKEDLSGGTKVQNHSSRRPTAQFLNLAPSLADPASQSDWREAKCRPRLGSGDYSKEDSESDSQGHHELPQWWGSFMSK